ncbi:alpha-(1,3)-fucosyltransferase 10-like [Sycon ciliatum]|uniref:alpha-(1,3)-fucosyltransferase 10-like n=1 Tax=Sycon ciliatum TaxID=27933 RepID=UPI0020ACAFD1|eukprot:scpid60814/ scgid12606/ Alpha-(1,3)-fucosyltransferase 10; Fucosyltransferase X; Galactoside 3-L-fucosyltransferase 10
MSIVRHLLFSMKYRRVECMKSTLLVLAVLVLFQVSIWSWYKGREREDLRPAMSWLDERMESLANEKRSAEEEELFQRLTFDYRLRSSPPSEEEVELHRHQYSIPNCDETQWQKEGASAGRCPYRTETRFPILLWWTQATYHKHLIRRCTYGRCVFTQNRRELGSPRTRAVLFKGRGLDAYDVPLPRKPNVEWFLFHDSAPHTAPVLYSPLAMRLFNLTATFSRFSDFPLTLQHIHDIESLKSHAWMTSLAEKQAAIDKGGALVVYDTDECNVPSDRDNLVRLLMDLMPVDFLGKCPSLDSQNKAKSRRKELAGWDKIREFAVHKFALVFETDICSDYIGESLWTALSCGTVPVYFGDAERLQSLLPHSKAVILVSDFPSLPDLVKHLKKLDSDDELYRQHLGHIVNKTVSHHLQRLFALRNYGGETSPLQDALDGFECFACDKVYEQLLSVAYSKPVKSHQANATHFSCHEPQPYSRSESYSWHKRWQDGRHTGDALYEMAHTPETNSSRLSAYFKHGEVEN